MARRLKKDVIRPAKGLTGAIYDRVRRRRERDTVEEAAQSIGFDRNDLSPHLEVQRVDIQDLKLANRRVRRPNAAQSKRIERSILKYGLVVPVLVDAELTVVHGHGVLEAAERIGIKTLPVIRIEHLAPARLRALAIELNRLGETAEWDPTSLREELLELVDLGEDVLSLGFERAEIDAILLAEEVDDVAENEDELELGEGADTQPNDLWQLGSSRLLQGDARNPAAYARLLDGRQARLVFTDEPYNVKVRGNITSTNAHREFAMASGELTREEFAEFNLAWMIAALRHLIDGGLLATFIDWRSIEIVIAAGRELDLELLNVIVWVKSNGGQGSLWRSRHELIPVFKNGQGQHVNNVALGKWRRSRTNVWEYAGASSIGSEARDGLDGHPTPKPRALLEDAILDVTDRADVVVDPFAAELRRPIETIGQKKDSGEDGFAGAGYIESVTDNKSIDPSLPVLAGTAWLFAREELRDSRDVLFVDEAGQVSLGNIVAMAPAARSLVLVGDQMQLAQPIQGAHPRDSGMSALDHLLQGEAVVPAERGIFLSRTWRMHPDLCRFVSEAVYDGALRSEAGCANQRLVLRADAHAALKPSGLSFRPVAHAGCRQRSEEEAVEIASIFASLLGQWVVDRRGQERGIGLDDILVVAPYNMQVNLLRARLPDGARVGTVDKFQGQEAEVVLVSMATSGADDMPRDASFLLSRNRLNVAISRARCLAILVASPGLLDLVASSVDEMRLANVFCWAEAYSSGQF